MVFNPHYLVKENLEQFAVTILFLKVWFIIINETINFYKSTVIQILFVEERKQWFVSSFVNGKLKLYDSCSTGGLTSSPEVQLAQIYGNQFALNSKLKVHFEPVLQQEGGIDCGVFSIANTYNAAMGKSTKDITLL